MTMAMKAIILIRLWGFVQGQSSSCELAHPDTCERLSSLESSFESFCRNFNSLRSNEEHPETICALDNIRCQLVDQGILPNQDPLSVAQERCADPQSVLTQSVLTPCFLKSQCPTPFSFASEKTRFAPSTLIYGFCTLCCEAGAGQFSIKKVTMQSPGWPQVCQRLEEGKILTLKFCTDGMGNFSERE